MLKPSHQPHGARRLRTIELILSVTEAKVYPGPITGGGPPVDSRCVSWSGASCEGMGCRLHQARGSIRSPKTIRNAGRQEGNPKFSSNNSWFLPSLFHFVRLYDPAD